MMDFYFDRGKKIENLEKYIKDYLTEHPDVTVYVGTDSQRRKRRKINYVSVICFRHPGKGVHVIHHRETGKFTKDLYTKLWNEVQYTVEVLKMINHTTYTLMTKETADVKPSDLNRDWIPKDKITVDLDLNSLKKWESNIAHDAAKGFITGLGYNVRTKPNGWAASRASNHLSKK